MKNNEVYKIVQQKKHIKISIILCFFIAFIICIPNSTLLVKAADTIIVDDDGTGDYTSIQDAIDNASVGDYIIVKDGTYGDQLTVNINDLTISAASGEIPTIYVSSYSPGINVISSDVLIEGFEIYGNGSLTGGPYPTIRASSGADGLIINNNEFKVFTGEVGQMGLYIASGVTDVIFTSNTFNNYEHDVFHAAWISGTQVFYGSIQDAIDDADTGDTINVEAGIYTERLVIGKELDLNGNGADSIIQPTNIPTPGVYDIEIDANGTILRNFLFDFNGAADTRSGNGIVVSDLNDPPVINVLISNNIIYTGDGGWGIQTGKYSDVSGLTISDNIFYADDDGMGEGVYINPFTGEDKVYIDDNEFYGNLYSAVSIESSNVTVSDNIIDSNISQGIHGVRFIDLTEGETFNNVRITDNNIQNVTYGILIGTTTDVGSLLTSTIYSNTIINNDVGIRAIYGANLSNSVYYNSLYNNSIYAINNEGTILVNASNNWWGDISGPYHSTSNPSGTGDNVTDNVTFYPWYEFDGGSYPPDVTYEVGAPNALNGEIISDTTQITISAEDNESGMDTLTYRTWDTINRWGEWIDYTDDFTLSSEGKNKVHYNATDNVGKKTSDTEIHYVDTTDPIVEVTYPNGGEYISGYLTILWDGADKIIDQGQTSRNNSLSISEDSPGHIQSFTPTEDELRSIQLLVEGDDGNVSVKIYSSIDPTPIPIGHSSQRLTTIGNPGNPVWIDFPFSSDIQLNTDATYYIGVSQEILGNTGINWYYFNSSGGDDPYNYGQAWLKKIGELESHPDWDFGFKTMKWEDDIDITVEYSMTGVSPWSTIAEDQLNDGSYTWDTTSYPDGESYRIRIIAEDHIVNMGADVSDDIFIINNRGPSITNIIITDTTIGSTDFTKDGDNILVEATITGDPISIEADLSGFSGGSSVSPTSYTGTTATWNVNSITCVPSDGPITVVITAYDSTGDSAMNTDSIIADNTGPDVIITRPGPGLYFMDSMRLLPFSYPFIIGQITISADATDEGSGIEQVEFYLENRLEANVTEVPYNWLWDEAATGFFKIEIIAYDNAGHSATEEMRDIFIINLDIFGHQSD